MDKFIVTEFRTRENTAFSKAPDDVLRVAKRLGFVELPVRSCAPKSCGLVDRIVARIKWWFEARRIAKALRGGPIVLLQATPGFLCRQAGAAFLARLKKNGVRFIYLIHDIAELREGKAAAGLSRLMMDRVFAVTDILIAHNRKMKDWLVDRGFQSEKIVLLDVFDYLLREDKIDVRAEALSDTLSVIVAGNLGLKKSPYIYRLGAVRNVTWKLYGPYYEPSQSIESIVYCGSFPPDELPNTLRGHFGLVWDGDSVDTCSGVTGEYLRYNNPHKLSLYLACGIPVIIWSSAAEADFVRDNNVGICVDSLRDISAKVREIGEDGYQRMCENCSRLAGALRTGEHTRKALKAALQGMD